MTQGDSAQAEHMTQAEVWLQGDRLARRGRRNEALTCYERAAHDDPDNARLHLRIGQCRYAEGDAKGARQAYRRALDIAPDNLPARLFLAIVELDHGALGPACSLLDEVVERQKENLSAISLRALAWYRGGDRSAALKQWRRAFCADPAFLSRLVVALESDRMADDGDEGNATGDDETSTIPQDASARRVRSICQRALDRKDYAEALAAIRRLTELRSADPETRYSHGCVALEAGAHEEAERALSQAMALQRRRDMRTMLPRLRKATRDEIREARKNTPTDPSLLAMRGLALARLGRCQEAREDLAAVKVEGPESYNKFYYLGLCALAEGHADDARKYLHYAFERYGADTIEFCLPDLMSWAERRYAQDTAATK
jgi:Flp pilus assembly protein TadD